MEKKWFKFAAVLLMVVFVILGCHSLFPKTDLGNHPITLKLSGWGASPVEQRLLQQVLDDFEVQHPQIKVKFEFIADQYMDVMKTRLIGDAAPDVFYLDALEAPFLMAQNVLEPLNYYITTAFDLADFEENLLKPFTYENQIYGLPKDFSTLALFYNKKVFAAAGLNQPPQTWDELLDYSKQLTIDRNQDGKIDQYGFGLMPELARQAYAIKAFGGQVVNEQGYAAFASEKGLAGLQLIVDQYRRDRTSVQASDVGTTSGSDMLGQGKVAMVIEGNWAIPYLAETFPELEFGTAQIPKLNHQRGTMAYIVAYVMNRQTQYKSQAWELIAYLTGKEGMKKWTGTGFALPTRKSVAEKLNYDHDALRKALLAGVDSAMPWQVGKYPAAIVNNFNNQFISAMLGQRSLQQAMLRAQEEANEQIKAAE